MPNTIFPPLPFAKATTDFMYLILFSGRRILNSIFLDSPAKISSMVMQNTSSLNFYVHTILLLYIPCANIRQTAFIAIRFCSGCTYFSSMVNQSVAEAVSFFWWYNLPQCHLYFFRIFHLVYKSDSIT